VCCHGLDKDGVAINFHHNHEVLVATKRLGGELADLVREHGFAYHVCLDVQVRGVACFQWHCLCFGGPYIFSCLVQMPLWVFDCLGVILLDVAFSQF
jgi:hypothetical protein